MGPEGALPFPRFEIASVRLVVAAITYASLIVGEFVLKQIALRNLENIAVRVAPAMTVLAKIASPIASILDISGRVVLRALGHKAQTEHRVCPMKKSGHGSRKPRRQVS